MTQKESLQQPRRNKETIVIPASKKKLGGRFPIRLEFIKAVKYIRDRLLSSRANRRGRYK